MTLGEKQREFAFHIACLIQQIYATTGYSCTFGDAYRDPRTNGVQGERVGYSEARSAHKNRLAVDLNLFLDGTYLKDTEDYRWVGDYWKALHRDNAWGGDFPADGNHFSRGHNGIK